MIFIKYTRCLSDRILFDVRDHLAFQIDMNLLFYLTSISKSDAPCLHNGHTKSAGRSSPSYT